MLLYVLELSTNYFENKAAKVEDSFSFMPSKAKIFARTSLICVRSQLLPFLVICRVKEIGNQMCH